MPSISARSIGGVQIRACLGRDLHGALEIRKKYADWFLPRAAAAIAWAAELERAGGTWTTAEVVTESDTTLLLGPRLWEALDAVFFYRPRGGQRRFRRSFLTDGTGVNLIRTSGDWVGRITPRWTPKGVARLKLWLRDQEKQGRIG
jgi:hypothetical protein